MGTNKVVVVVVVVVVFLVFIIDSIPMTVSLTQDKITKIKTLLSSLLENSFCSFRPDPEASFINVFTQSWANTCKKLYCFPAFSCISQELQKIIQDIRQIVW